MARRCSCGTDIVIKLKEGNVATFTYQGNVSTMVYKYYIVDPNYRSRIEIPETSANLDNM